MNIFKFVLHIQLQIEELSLSRTFIIAFQAFDEIGIDSLIKLCYNPINAILLKGLFNSIEQLHAKLLNVVLLHRVLIVPLKGPSQLGGVCVSHQWFGQLLFSTICSILIHLRLQILQMGKELLQLVDDAIFLARILLSIVFPFVDHQPEVRRHEQCLQQTVHVASCALVAQPCKAPHEFLSFRLILL